MINLFRRSFLFGASALAATPFVRSAAAQSTPMEAIDFGAMLKYPFGSRRCPMATTPTSRRSIR